MLLLWVVCVCECGPTCGTRNGGCFAGTGSGSGSSFGSGSCSSSGSGSSSDSGSGSGSGDMAVGGAGLTLTSSVTSSPSTNRVSDPRRGRAFFFAAPPAGSDSGSGSGPVADYSGDCGCGCGTAGSAIARAPSGTRFVYMKLAWFCRHASPSKTCLHPLHHRPLCAF